MRKREFLLLLAFIAALFSSASATDIITKPEPWDNQFFAVKRIDITALSNFTFNFGFVSRKLALELPATNTDEICVDWSGTGAVCPAVNAAGDDRLRPGTAILLDDFHIQILTIRAASGTQTIYVRAWR